MEAHLAQHRGLRRSLHRTLDADDGPERHKALRVGRRRRGRRRDRSAERLEQGGGIGIAIGARLNQPRHGLLIGLLGADQRQLIYRLELELMMHHIQGLLRGFRGAARGVESVRIGIEGVQGIRHILKRGQHG
jgi:hypothetical protein